MEKEYECASCGHKQIVCTGDIWLDKLADGVLDLCDAGPEALDCIFYADLKIDILCQKQDCQNDLEVFVRVEATADWDESRENCDPRINYFDIVNILELLPQDSGCQFSYVHNEDYYDESISEELSDSGQGEEEALQLEIIVKTFMNKGYCYLGFDYNTGRIIRPITRTLEGKCCWPNAKNFNVGDTYTFTINHPHNGEPQFTSLPHSIEDRLVHTAVEVTDLPNHGVLFEKLNTIARDSVGEIFSNIHYMKYVDEGEKCPSTGVLRCNGHEIKLKTYNYNKRRVHIGNYEFPITAVDAHFYPKEFKDAPTLVVLGLGRPFDGNRYFNPKRCYILVLRILQDFN